MFLLAALCSRPFLLLPRSPGRATPRGLQQKSQPFAACKVAMQDLLAKTVPLQGAAPRGESATGCRAVHTAGNFTDVQSETLFGGDLQQSSLCLTKCCSTHPALTGPNPHTSCTILLHHFERLPKPA